MTATRTCPRYERTEPRPDCARCQRSAVGRCRFHPLRRPPPDYRHAAETLARAVWCLAIRSGEVSFSIDDIVLEAWRLDRQRFGMRSNPDYPDSARVVAEMCARRGPVELGWLRRVNGRVALTEAGAQAVQREGV